jgi:hypothetical protein
MMKRFVLSGFACSLALTMLPAQDQAAEQVTLTHKIPDKWTYVLPKETWTPISNGIHITHGAGTNFATEVQGSALAVDINGDGKVDEKAKGISSEMKLKAKTVDGKPFTYGVRFKKTGDAWSHSAGGAMVGKAKGTNIAVIDQNNNGVYNDYGVDAMVVGSGDAAAYLSRVVNLGGELFSFDISADGTSANIAPFAGESGTVDVRTAFEGNGDIRAVVISNEKGDVSFNAAATKKALRVPAGQWVISGGLVANGSETVRVRQGNMAAIAVAAGKETALSWGGPIKIDFNYTLAGDKLTVPYNLKYFGKSGEEYHDFLPDATSPQIVVMDKKKRILLSTSRFPGC